MGYSLCKIEDFQTCLFSRIFGVSSSGFLHRTTLMFLQNCFTHMFGIFNFSPKLTILKRLQTLHGLELLQDGRFSNLSYISNIWCFFDLFFAQNSFNILAELFFACFWHFQFLTLTDHFEKAINFAWAIAFARWPIFKLVLFLEYLVFFRAVFCTEQL